MQYFVTLAAGRGNISAGMEMQLLDRPAPDWSIARANSVMHHEKQNLSAAQELADLKFLSASWQKTLLARVDHA